MSINLTSIFYNWKLFAFEIYFLESSKYIFYNFLPNLFYLNKEFKIKFCRTTRTKGRTKRLNQQLSKAGKKIIKIKERLVGKPGKTC